MEYKAVIFDFNGTLFLDNDKHVKAWGEISRQIRGKGIEEEELHKYVNGVPNQQVISYFFGKDVDEDILQKYSKLKESYYRKFCKEDIDSFHLVNGSERYFDYLINRNIPFTIASASIKDNIDFFISSFYLEDWFDINTIVYDNGSYIDKVQMFLDAASKIHVDIKDVLIIEDSLSGIKNAYEAGCRNIVVLDSAGFSEEYKKLPGVICIVKDFDELLSMNTK